MLRYSDPVTRSHILLIGESERSPEVICIQQLDLRICCSTENLIPGHLAHQTR